MSVQTCNRCGQLLLPEIVRELGQGKHCPFCGAALEQRAAKAAPAVKAETAIKPEAAAKPEAATKVRPMPAAAPATAPSVRPPLPGVVPPAAASVARPSQAPTKSTIFRASGAPAPAAAIAVAPPAPEPRKATNPVLTLVPTPPPEIIPPPAPPKPASPASSPVVQAAAVMQTAAGVTSPLIKPSLFQPVPAASPATGPVASRRRRLAVSVALALVGVTCFVIVHARSARAPAGAVPPIVAAPEAATPPSTAAPAPDQVVEKKAPAVVPDDGSVTAGSQRVHRHKDHQDHKDRKHQPSRASSRKHGREVALHAPAAPAQPGDDTAARAAYEKGNRLLLNGDTSGAVAAYEEATRLAPASPAGYRGLGLAYEKQGKSAQAARSFRTYLKLAPGADDRALIAERLQRLAPPHKSGKRSR